MDSISIRGAKVHNLKNIDVSLPRNKLVVLTGLSGSGKSSLAFDTIYAEGQRRYVETTSARASKSCVATCYGKTNGIHAWVKSKWKTSVLANKGEGCETVSS